MSQALSIVALPGDGIGPEVMAEGLKVLEAAAALTGFRYQVESIPCGGKFYLQHGTRDWPEGAEEKCARADFILLAAVGWPDPKGGGPVTMPGGRMAGYSAVIGNRVELDLYANVRPVQLYEGLKHRIHGAFSQVWRPEKVDMVFLRENTEDLYCGIGGTLHRGGRKELAVDDRVITRVGSERVIRRAFEICKARQRGAPATGRKKVTAILKHNVMDGCRLFGEIFDEIAVEYPGIETEKMIVDAFTQSLITEPERYDVLVTTNLFGDIVTDLASVLQGGMGLAVGCNLGDQHAMFEPIHGSAPPLVGGKANPLAMILAVKEALAWQSARNGDAKLLRGAEAIERAVRSIVRIGTPLTADLVPSSEARSTSEVGDAVIAALGAAALTT
ncbi:MAG: isocitrate/isopropylmalate dehydrogenase family protein [Planctomycetes bacterium]|nr:isocitrate/isopropylmalate dehydrogenase family protein [Planctomycetota bacterium]